MPTTDVLVAVRREDASRYHKFLAQHKDFRVRIVMDARDALDALADRDQHTDVFVVDNAIGYVFELIAELRQTYPRLMVILVDEQADFGMPGRADDVSTEPFENDDLAKRITRLMSDRQLETLRADSLPSVRDFAKQLRKATGEIGKQQAAVAACRDLGYDYVAFYRMENGDPNTLTLKAQDGPPPAMAGAPKQASPDDIMTWVARSGQSRIAGAQDTPNHPFVSAQRLGAVACVPIQMSKRFGVLVACREKPASITQENVMMLELVSAQLAAVLTRENIN